MIKYLHKKTFSKNECHYHRLHHQVVFNEISSLIGGVIMKGHCFLLVYLQELYINSLDQFFQESSVEMNATFTAHHLEDKIMKISFKDTKLFTVRSKKIIAPNYLPAIDDTVFVTNRKYFAKSCIDSKKINTANCKEKVTD